MARRRKQNEEKQPESNRGRPGARGVFLIFERGGKRDGAEAESRRRDEDEPLARDDGDRAA